MRRFTALAFGLVAALVAPAVAHAWACPDDPPAQLLTATSRPLPRNVALLVRFAAPFDPAHARELRFEGPQGSTPATVIPLPRQLGLVRAARPLAASARHVLTWVMTESTIALHGMPSYAGTASSRDAADARFARTRRFAVEAFTTSATLDTQPPQFFREPATWYEDQRFVTWTHKSDPPGPPTVSRARAWPRGFVDAGAARDDQTPSDELLFLAWVVDPASSSFAFGEGLPGDARRASNGQFIIGDASHFTDCALRHQAPFPKGLRQIPMAVIAIDHAGNPSRPHYFTLDRSRPRTKPPQQFRD